MLNNYHKKVYIETPKIIYHDTHKIIKKYTSLLAYIKMDQKIITFSKNQDKSYTMTV